MLVIIPGKLREACYKLLKVNHFVSLILRTKAIESNLKPKLPYLLSSTLFCDVSLVMWTTTKERWAVCVVTSMRGKSRCREVGFQIRSKLSCHILYCRNSRVAGESSKRGIRNYGIRNNGMRNSKMAAVRKCTS